MAAALPVTPEMLKAGLDVLGAADKPVDWATGLPEVYRAMAAVAPISPLHGLPRRRTPYDAG